MKKLLLPSLCVLFILFVICVYYWWRTSVSSPVNLTNPQSVSFTITKGEPASSVISRLKRHQLIKSELASKIYLKLHRLDGRIKPGAYLVSPGVPLSELIAVLTSGPKDLWVTIPEGWRREQIASRLNAGLTSFNVEEFIHLTADSEGFLFPDTYLIPAEASPSAVLNLMLSNFSKKTLLSPASSEAKDIVTLASLIEREAKADGERPVIAGILTKRLSAGWPLQIDATVQFARDSENCKTQILNCKYWEPIYDTRYPSVYNTYLHTGLPPGPISNPGLASISAAKSPTSSPYWYYLHDSSGQIHFANDLAQHNSNIDKYLLP